MKRFAGIAFALVAMLAVAVPAAAQSGISGNRSLFLPADSVTSQPPRQGSTQIDIRGQIGGFFCCSEEGFILGGGVGARPFSNEQVEVVGDFSFLRFGGSNGIYFSGNGLYHFKTNEPNFSPFAGAGLGIIHIADETEVRFQIAGGLEFNRSGKYPIRPEIRFIFTEGDTTTVLLVSIGLAKR